MEMPSTVPNGGTTRTRSCGPGLLTHPGTRPSIWWRLATPEERPEGESQASFLRRHRLFLRGEERRVPAGAYEPEPVDAWEGRGDAA